MNIFKKIKELEKKVAALELVLQEQPKNESVLDIEVIKKSIMDDIKNGVKSIPSRTNLIPL